MKRHRSSQQQHHRPQQEEVVYASWPERALFKVGQVVGIVLALVSIPVLLWVFVSTAIRHPDRTLLCSAIALFALSVTVGPSKAPPKQQRQQQERHLHGHRRTQSWTHNNRVSHRSQRRRPRRRLVRSASHQDVLSTSDSFDGSFSSMSSYDEMDLDGDLTMATATSVSSFSSTHHENHQLKVASSTRHPNLRTRIAVHPRRLVQSRLWPRPNSPARA